jgi:hypothetical protein
MTKTLGKGNWGHSDIAVPRVLVNELVNGLPRTQPIQEEAARTVDPGPIRQRLPALGAEQ